MMLWILCFFKFIEVFSSQKLFSTYSVTFFWGVVPFFFPLHNCCSFVWVWKFCLIILGQGTWPVLDVQQVVCAWTSILYQNLVHRTALCEFPQLRGVKIALVLERYGICYTRWLVHEIWFGMLKFMELPFIILIYKCCWSFILACATRASNLSINPSYHVFLWF